jgi:hypothetical protein
MVATAANTIVIDLTFIMLTRRSIISDSLRLRGYNDG